MFDKFKAFLERHDSFIVSTHDPADADGLGAQMVLGCILKGLGKKFRLVNSGRVPEQFAFACAPRVVEEWDDAIHESLPESSAIVIVDTSDERQMGRVGEAVGEFREAFVIDHHETTKIGAPDGIRDTSASATCELMVELALALGTEIDAESAFAAYVGLVYDTGFFAYPKVGPRTFKVALELARLGANPSEAFRMLCENRGLGSLLLQRKAVAGMSVHFDGRVALQVLRRDDFAEAGAVSGDTDGFVNFPLKVAQVRASIFVKETPEGKISCSLRSKGDLNVALVAAELGGGGHFNASGFKSGLGFDDTVAAALSGTERALGVSGVTGDER